MPPYRSRYTRTRLFGYAQHFGEISAPFIWDRSRRTLTPYRHQDWEYLFDCGYLPSVRGGAFGGQSSFPRWYMGTLVTVAGSASTVSLNNAYTYASAGNATGGRVRLYEAWTLTNIYFFVSSYTGTAANVNDLNVEFRNTTSNLPGSTLHASASVDPASATGWINVSGLSFAASNDTDYWVSVGDADGSGTDFAVILNRHTGVDQLDVVDGDRMCADTTNGWTAATLRAFPINVLTHYSASNVTIGNPFSAVANTTSSTNRRGFYIGGFTEQVQLLGMVNPVGNTSMTGVELYLSTATTPGTGQVATGAYQLYQGGTSSPSGYFFDSVQTLSKATAYRCVFTYSGATNTPRKLSMGTGSSAAIRLAGLGKGTFYFAGANGTTNWSEDDQDAIPQAVLVFEDQVEIATGGGLARIIGG